MLWRLGGDRGEGMERVTGRRMGRRTQQRSVVWMVMMVMMVMMALCVVVGLACHLFGLRAAAAFLLQQQQPGNRRRPILNPVDGFATVNNNNNNNNNNTGFRRISVTASSSPQLGFQANNNVVAKPGKDDKNDMPTPDVRNHSNMVGGGRGGGGGCGQSFHGRTFFERDFREMVSNFKVFVYPYSVDDPFKNSFLPVEFEPFGNYASESYFKKALNGSVFMTNNASEAHLFFLPFSIARLRHDERVGIAGLEGFLKAYITGIRREWPYWNRTDGADHFFVSCHSITRTVVEKVKELRVNVIQVVCSANTYRQGYVPHKDVSLPQIWPRKDVHPEVKLIAQRNKLAFFAGAVNSEVRASLLRVWSNDSDILVHSGRIPTPYAEAFLTSKFCLHVKGFEVNTARVADALHYGCVPVIIASNYDLPFKDILDWKQFSVVVSPFDIPWLKEILIEVVRERYVTLHKNVMCVRKHFQWHAPPMEYDSFYMVMYELWLRRHIFRSPL